MDAVWNRRRDLAVFPRLTKSLRSLCYLTSGCERGRCAVNDKFDSNIQCLPIPKSRTQNFLTFRMAFFVIVDSTDRDVADDTFQSLLNAVRELQERTRVLSKYSKFVSSSEDEDAEPGPSRGRRRSRGSPLGHRHRGNAHAASYSPENNDIHMKTDDEQASTPESVKEEEKSAANALPAYFPAISGCRSVDKFDCLNRIEEGTYGVVYRAKDKHSDEIVALKRLKKEKEDFPITAMREIVTLLKAQHQNVVTVREIVVGSNMDKIYIVMDYVQHDLKSLMETMKTPFRIGEVKTLMRQLLAGVRHLHENWILHRDLKASNLLLSHDGILKIGDFGLAREYGSPLKPYTQVVVTLWYRAPELLLGTKFYSCAIDMWSVGCIFGEFLNLKPLFPGKSEIDELNKIYKDLGSPSERIWPGFNELPGAKRLNLPHVPTNTLRKRFDADLSEAGFDLLSKSSAAVLPASLLNKLIVAMFDFVPNFDERESAWIQCGDDPPSSGDMGSFISPEDLLSPLKNPFASISPPSTPSFPPLMPPGLVDSDPNRSLPFAASMCLRVHVSNGLTDWLSLASTSFVPSGSGDDTTLLGPRMTTKFSANSSDADVRPSVSLCYAFPDSYNEQRRLYLVAKLLKGSGAKFSAKLSDSNELHLTTRTHVNEVFSVGPEQDFHFALGARGLRVNATRSGSDTDATVAFNLELIDIRSSNFRVLEMGSGGETSTTELSFNGVGNT